MGLLDDARRLLAIDPFVNVWAHSSGEYECFACEADWQGESSKHEPDCPWLGLPRIIAALEAAEALLRESARASTNHAPNDLGFCDQYCSTWPCEAAGIRAPAEALRALLSGDDA